jgi:hypothetical protein
MYLFLKALPKLRYFVLSAITFLPFVVASQARVEKYTLDFYHLKGKVGYMEEIKYSAEESVNGLQKGKVLQKQSYRFDTAGNLLDEEMHFGSDFRRNTYTYSKSGKLLADESYDEGGLSDFSTYDYDITGTYVTCETLYNKNGSVSSRIKKQYDARGNRTEVIAYGRDGNMTSKTTYGYNDKGYLIEEHLNNVTPNALEVTWISGYDDRGNRTRLDCYEPGKAVYKQTFAFDANRNKIEDNVLDDNGNAKHKVTYTYDDKGNETEITETGPDGTIQFKTVITYEYDKSANWVNSTHSINGTPKYIYERKIIYHP